MKSFFKYSCVFTVNSCLKIFEKIEKIEKNEKIEKTPLTFPGLTEPGCEEFCSWGSSGRTILFVGAQVEQFCSWGSSGRTILFVGKLRQSKSVRGKLRSSNSVRGEAQVEQFCSCGSSGRHKHDQQRARPPKQGKTQRAEPQVSALQSTSLHYGILVCTAEY